MEELVRWTSKAVAEDSLHPLLIVAVFVVVFLAIHPFQEGNGRLSRILTTLRLLRAGYSYVPYASLESVVEDNKDLYYKVLHRTQTTLKKVERERTSDDSSRPALSVEVLVLLRRHERLTIAEIVGQTGAIQTTLKKRLRQLVAAGRIQRHGKARATWSILSK